MQLAKRLGALFILVWLPLAASAEPPQYVAIYEVVYKGRTVGESSFSISAAHAAGEYQYRSETRVKGLLRLVSPNAAIDLSRFGVEGNSVRPIEFVHEDGSRKGEDNFSVGFDWSNSTASLMTADDSHSIALKAGILDRGTLQVQLMLDLERGAILESFEVIDDDGLKSYAYEELEPAELETEQGKFTTRRFRQQREGSSRSTIISMAPSLHHIPARIEQIRDNEVETLLTLVSVEFYE
jgi:hypothetical protein